ncbi:MAG: Uma2 family endonuclease [Pyrinomonadaceae bacterium]|nr:Uma2 family endonuclease [Pyrinomonadaceae bacterium]
MGLAKLKTKISVEDYLAGEKTSPVKYEYVHGEVYAMAGTSDNHNRIVGNIYAGLLNRLRNSTCEPFMGDIKVRVSPHVYYYPDVLVSCEQNPESPYFRSEPILIAEIVSPSTQEIDRREKLLFYQQMPSVQEYVVIEQQKMLVEIHRRQADGRWITYYFNENADEEVEFQSVELTMTLGKIYQRVKFENSLKIV